MKTKIVEDKASIETILEQAREEILMLGEEMRTWSDNLSGTPLENTMKYEQVEECADQLEEIQSNLESVEVPEELKSKEVSFKYSMPKTKYIGRSWRLSQAIAGLQAISEFIPDIEDEISTLEGIEFPGMY